MPATLQTAIFIIYLGFISAFLLYHGIISSESIKKFITSKSIQENASRNQVFLYRISGFTCFFIIPVGILFLLEQISFNDLNLIPRITPETAKFSLLIAVPLVLLSVLTSKSPQNLDEYPQIRTKDWSSRLLLSSALTWILYLFAYEVTFRGILFFVLLEPLGLMPAIAINVTIYALVHVPKSFREAVGSVPLGVVLCLAAWKTESFMVAFIAHSILALSNEWLSVYHHPEMKFNLKKND